MLQRLAQYVSLIMVLGSNENTAQICLSAKHIAADVDVSSLGWHR